MKEIYATLPCLTTFVIIAIYHIEKKDLEDIHLNKRICSVVISGLMLLTLLFGVMGCTMRIVDASSESAKSGIERNYGLAYQSVTVNLDENDSIGAFDAADVVPAEETVSANLEGKDYEIEQTETVFESDIEAMTISARKDNSFCIISYCLDQAEAEKGFAIYEKKFSEDDYYIMAQNGAFVYCMSDENAFRDAGFSELANSGIQIINHYNVEAR